MVCPYFALRAIGIVITTSVHAICVLSGDPYGMSLFSVSGSRPCKRQLGSCNLNLAGDPYGMSQFLRFGQSAL